MAAKCSVSIGDMPKIVDPACGTKLFVIGSDGKGYYIKIDDLWEACPPLRIRQQTFAAPGSGTDWTASSVDTINYPAGFSGGELTVIVFKLRGE